MKVRAKFPISVGTGKKKKIIPKGEIGGLIAVTNVVPDEFPKLKATKDGYFYICRFPSCGEVLVTKEQVELNPEAEKEIKKLDVPGSCCENS